MWMSQKFSGVHVVLSFACGLATVHFLGQWLEGGGGGAVNHLHARRNELRKASQEGNRVFTLAVSLKFRDAQKKTAFLSLISAYSRYVEEHEPTTLTYKVMQSDKDPLEMLLLERYINKNAYLEIHRKSPEFIRFREDLTALSGAEHAGGPPGVVLQGSSYDDFDQGFFAL
jgi:quinol monooxygenase YgiN